MYQRGNGDLLPVEAVGRMQESEVERLLNQAATRILIVSGQL